MSKQASPKIRKLPAAKQRRLDQLLSKNAEGTIRASELTSLRKLVAEAEELMVSNSKELADFARRNASPTPPAAAVPVTVWVNPQMAEH